MPEGDRLELSKSLDSSFMTIDSAGNMMAKTPQGALIAATTYLLSNPPPQVTPARLSTGPPSPASA